MTSHPDDSSTQDPGPADGPAPGQVGAGRSSAEAVGGAPGSVVTASPEQVGHHARHARESDTEELYPVAVDLVTPDDHIADPYAVGDSGDPAAEEPRGDWAWIEEWRAGSEPTPWGPGLIISGFVAVVVAVAVYVITAGLADRPLFAVAANIVVVAGLSPALWLSRGLPVLRWVALGGAAGVLAAWFAIVTFPIG